MQQSHDDFRPQTLPEQLLAIWRRSGFAEHLRLIYAVIGWAVLSMLMSAVVMVFYRSNAQQWFGITTSEIPMWFVNSLNAIRGELVWLGSIQLVLWSQWRWPTRVPIGKFVLLAFGMTAFSALLRYPSWGASFRVDRLLSMWFSDVIVLAWYVLLVRSLSTFIRFHLVTPDAASIDTQAGRSWSLRGLFLATLLVAITIAVKRWTSSLYDEFSQPFSRGVMAWLEIMSLGYMLISTLLLVYAAAAIYVGRGFLLPVTLVVLTALLVIAGSALSIVLLPASVVQIDWNYALTDWAFRAAVVVSLHLAAFRAWRWAGYSLRRLDYFVRL